MGNISLHTGTGTTVQPFVFEGTKFEFQSMEYTTENSNGNKESENAALICKNETQIETEKNENSPSTFHSNGTPIEVNSESGSPSTFAQPNSYSFQNYS